MITLSHKEQRIMRKHAPQLIALALSASLAGTSLAEQDKSPQAAEPENPAQALVKVGDFMVTNLHFALFASQTGREPREPEEQVRLLNELVNNFMVADSPQGRALATEPEVAAALEVARARLIAQTFVRSELQKAPVSEAQIQALYDQEYGSSGRLEYKARHILLATEEEAREVIKALDGGADFAELASTRSIGPSKSVGGDLGWFEADQMVGEFSEATANLEDGSFSAQPVKTQFGWHVILREQSRALPQPSLESVKAELEQRIQQEHVARVVGEIRKSTKIEVQDLD